MNEFFQNQNKNWRNRFQRKKIHEMPKITKEKRITKPKTEQLLQYNSDNIKLRNKQRNELKL